jgi:hypothetical protein
LLASEAIENNTQVGDIPMSEFIDFFQKSPIALHWLSGFHDTFMH